MMLTGIYSQASCDDFMQTWSISFSG